MYVILYQPEEAPPEIFGPYSSPAAAVNALRHIAGAAGDVMDISHSALLATIDVLIGGERHRYQLLKMASTTQLDIHAEVIMAEREAGTVKVQHHLDQPSRSRLSGY